MAKKKVVTLKISAEKPPLEGDTITVGAVTAEFKDNGKPGIIKEFTQNGIRYQRTRHANGGITDIRI